MNTRKIGYDGEKLAAQHLKNHGYEIITTNYHCRFGEIDIIASKNGFLVFFEVKLRSSTFFGTPASAVTKTKQKRLIEAALHYLGVSQIQDKQPRFDVIEINNNEINHIENAFFAE
jgi:putative endonuclease